MVTSPQDHWMIKEKILKFEGKRKDKTKFGPIRGGFLEENWQFKKKKFQRQTKVFDAEVSQPKKRGRKTVRRELKGGGG